MFPIKEFEFKIRKAVPWSSLFLLFKLDVQCCFPNTDRVKLSRGKYDAFNFTK